MIQEEPEKLPGRVQPVKMKKKIRMNIGPEIVCFRHFVVFTKYLIYLYIGNILKLFFSKTNKT